jgi:hypothetical protein
VPYFLIQDFSDGLDARKSPATLPAGSLRYANNVHVTRGGEIEKRKAFVAVATLPPGSVGLASDRDNLLVFGNGVNTVVSPYVAIQWVNCGADPAYLLDSTRWSNIAVSTIAMLDGTRRLMIDWRPVTQWDYGTFPVGLETFRGKVYAVVDANFVGSGLFDPDRWGPAITGSFITDTSMQSQFMAKLNACCVFQGSLVLFSEDGIQVWEVDPDPAKNYLVRSLTNCGCIAPQSVLNFGNFDTVFLSKSGIRSLQARQATDLMNVNDIGTPVDDFVSALVSQLDIEAIRRSACAVVEPEDARLWLSLGDVIMVHSYYRGSEISAWSTYTPGFHVDGMTVLDGKVWVRSGDVVYLYGGLSQTEYDASKAEVWTPYHHADKPATPKAFTGFDIGCTGEWTIKAAFDPNRLDLTETVGKVTNSTFCEPNQSMHYYTTHMGLVLESTAASKVTLSTAAMHYTEGAPA